MLELKSSSTSSMQDFWSAWEQEMDIEYSFSGENNICKIVRVSMDFRYLAERLYKECTGH